MDRASNISGRLGKVASIDRHERLRERERERDREKREDVEESKTTSSFA